MSRRAQIYVLIGLLVLAAVVYLANRSQVPGFSGVLAADTKFTPLNIQEPQLRLDLLAKIKQEVYAGAHRDIFNAMAPPITPGGGAVPGKPAPPKIVGAPYPLTPGPPPPVQVPGEFFGYASMPQTGRRVAFFKEGDDVLVVPEGDTFLVRFRLIHIATDSADVLEIASGRHANVPMVAPLTGDQPPSNP
jgi:hypothetical protein